MTLATYGAGKGTRAVFVVQSSSMLNNLGKNARDEILNSSTTQIYKAIREVSEAERLSRTIGETTIERPDFRTNMDARIGSMDAMRAVQQGKIMPSDAGRILAEKQAYLQHMTKDRRRVFTPDEIIAMSSGNCLVWMPGDVERPMLLNVPHYWQRRDLAGRFLKDPDLKNYPDHVVEINHRGRQVLANIITEPTPDELQHLAQYGSHWRYVQGYRPRLPRFAR
ncbi:MAG: TraM recognition domain-containing protein [Hyphomicrobiales bacterium]|nr:TraM recognition domain-containing protein [Hyphomicrobiales bacterium]